MTSSCWVPSTVPTRAPQPLSLVEAIQMSCDWYLDGQEIFNAPIPSTQPVYVMITNGVRGGWPVSLAPAQVYKMRMAYIAVWTHTNKTHEKTDCFAFVLLLFSRG